MTHPLPQVVLRNAAYCFLPSAFFFLLTSPVASL